jgi:hypothetical protein
MQLSKCEIDAPAAWSLGAASCEALGPAGIGLFVTVDSYENPDAAAAYATPREAVHAQHHGKCRVLLHPRGVF